jgi:hypothetical protein
VFVEARRREIESIPDEFDVKNDELSNRLSNEEANKNPALERS